jgi:hypothetical protein
MEVEQRLTPSGARRRPWPRRRRACGRGGEEAGGASGAGVQPRGQRKDELGERKSRGAAMRGLGGGCGGRGCRAGARRRR